MERVLTCSCFYFWSFFRIISAKLEKCPVLETSYSLSALDYHLHFFSDQFEVGLLSIPPTSVPSLHFKPLIWFYWRPFAWLLIMDENRCTTSFLLTFMKSNRCSIFPPFQFSYFSQWSSTLSQGLTSVQLVDSNHPTLLLIVKDTSSLSETAIEYQIRVSTNK